MVHDKWDIAIWTFGQFPNPVYQPVLSTPFISLVDQPISLAYQPGTQACDGHRLRTGMFDLTVLTSNASFSGCKPSPLGARRVLKECNQVQTSINEY